MTLSNRSSDLGTAGRVASCPRLMVIKQDESAFGSCGKPHCRGDRVPRHHDPLIVTAFDQSEFDQSDHVRVNVLVVAPEQPCEFADRHGSRKFHRLEERPARRREILEQYRKAFKRQLYLGTSGSFGDASLPRLLEPSERT